MGYECPVCATPQADRRHLADHLAVTAMTHGDEHEDWLDEHVPDWSEHSPRSLGDALAEYATETGYDQVFEDTVAHDHADATSLEDALADATRGPGRGELTDEHRAVLEDAVAMTETMVEKGGDENGETGEDANGDRTDGNERAAGDDGDDNESENE